MWTLPQRAVILAFVVGMLIYLSIRFAVQHTYVSDPVPAVGALADRVADRIDPNTATHGMLAALPNVGEKLAQAIIDYREQFQKSHPGRPAFEKTEDLRNVRGIGPLKIESLNAFLRFSPAAVTRPSR